MKAAQFASLFLVLILITNPKAQSKITPRLNAILSQSEKQEFQIPVIIYLHDSVDISDFDLPRIV